ncbi:MAG: efflux RND transporter periplasmic adaptor subunit [Pseudomonadales bacterium]
MNKSILLTGAIMLSVGFGVGYWLFGSGMSSHSETEKSAMVDKEKQPLFYRSPMNPEVTSPVPAKGPMGMDYIPVYVGGEGNNASAGTVKIDSVVVQNLGVRTAIAKKTAISRTIRAVGRVDFDEERMARLHPKVEGWIEEIRIDKTGQRVNKNDILLSIYSPKLVSTQQEYLLALNNLTALEKSPFEEIRRGAQELVKSSRQRLQLLDVSEHQIHELEKNRQVKKSLHIHSPVAGTVIRIGSRQGQHVSPGTELYMLVDLSQVWVYANIYENELPWVKEGDQVEMTLASVPGKTFTGSLAYIYPYAEAKTRTIKVRLVFDNSERLLRPNMFAEVIIRADSQPDALVIPSEAVIRSGQQTQVFVVRGAGKFEPRIVKLGIESEGQVAVLAGVEAGEEVVTSAQFLLDSESKLREATAKMVKSLNEEKTADGDMSSEAINHSTMEMPAQESMDTVPEMIMNRPSDMKMSHDDNMSEQKAMPSHEGMTEHGAHQHD